jgi:hypothetical protein
VRDPALQAEKKQTIIFEQDFLEKRGAARFKLRSVTLDLFNLRVLSFPFLDVSVSADPACPDFLLFVQICRNGGAVVVWLFGSG